MKLKRSVLSILAGFLLLFPLTVSADNNQNNTALTINQKKIVFLPSGETNDVTTINVEGYNYLKLRDMEMGKRATVSYDSNTKEITVKNNKSNEIYKIKSNELKKDNKIISLIAPTVNKDGYTYLSIRDWANMINLDVKSFENNKIELVEKEISKSNVEDLKKDDNLKLEESKKENTELPQWYIDESTKEYDDLGYAYPNFLAKTRGVPGDQFMDMLGKKYNLTWDTMQAYKDDNGFDSGSMFVVMNKGEGFHINGNLEKLRPGGYLKSYELKSLTPIINTMTGEVVGSKLNATGVGGGFKNTDMYLGSIYNIEGEGNVMTLASQGEAAAYSSYETLKDIKFVMFSMPGKDLQGNDIRIKLVFFNE